jgi:hypothetical protein
MTKREIERQRFMAAMLETIRIVPKAFGDGEYTLETSEMSQEGRPEKLGETKSGAGERRSGLYLQ